MSIVGLMLGLYKLGAFNTDANTTQLGNIIGITVQHFQTFCQAPNREMFILRLLPVKLTACLPCRLVSQYPDVNH